MANKYMGVDLPEYIDMVRGSLLMNVNSKEINIEVFKTYLEKFLKKAGRLHMPKLGENYRYSVEINSEGICLWLEYFSNPEDRSFTYRSRVMSVEAVYMNTEEFVKKFIMPEQGFDIFGDDEEEAKKYDAAVKRYVATIRQHIKRCKIKYAKKLSDRWYFPEFVKLPEGRKKQMAARYDWDFMIITPDYEPEEAFGELIMGGEFNSIIIFDGIVLYNAKVDAPLVHGEKYTIMFRNHDRALMYRTFYVTKERRDKLETFLIGNPFVRYVFGAGESMSRLREYEEEQE